MHWYLSFGGASTGVGFDFSTSRLWSRTRRRAPLRVKSETRFVFGSLGNSRATRIYLAATCRVNSQFARPSLSRRFKRASGKKLAELAERDLSA